VLEVAPGSAKRAKGVAARRRDVQQRRMALRPAVGGRGIGACAAEDTEWVMSSSQRIPQWRRLRRLACRERVAQADDRFPI